jgi:hypothetical protein
MIQFSKTFTRPNTEILWHNQVLDNTEYLNQLVPNYIETEKLLEQFLEYSEDSLIMTYVAIWSDQESFDEYDIDPILNTYWTARDEYCSTNNIILGPGTFNSI